MKRWKPLEQAVVRAVHNLGLCIGTVLLPSSYLSDPFSVQVCLADFSEMAVIYLTILYNFKGRKKKELCGCFV